MAGAEHTEGVAIRVRGLVQGVGFRPTVWRLAHECGLAGEVLNDGEGVLIRVWGPGSARAVFLARLEAEAPPLSRIDAIECAALSGTPPTDAFRIVDSEVSPVATGIVPDAATCAECLAEISDPTNRRFRYPFTNCTHCGPRLSIIKALPYDRAQTSMAAFPMCPACAAEYTDPADRRFHAQPNACPECGPRVWLEDWTSPPLSHGERTEFQPRSTLPLEEERIDDDPIVETARLIQSGAIVAIKGIGGFHLACDATNAATVETLRARKRRYGKPLALMARDAAMIRRYAQLDAKRDQASIAPLDAERDQASIAQLDAAEEALLNARAAPIVLLDRSTDSEPLAPALAPGQNTLGFMLPYTPLHHLLMAELDRPIVLTSGNLSDEPQCIDNDDARARLATIADYALMHDRDIVNRLDDSVVRIAAGSLRVLRRARGLAPTPLWLPPGFERAENVLAMGAALKSTFCMLRGGEAIVSQHIGDLDDAATHADYRKALALYRDLYQFACNEQTRVAVDLHPDYPSTRWGETLADAEGLPLTRVQHHHAHVAACLAEHGHAIDAGPVLGVVLDGLGYGDDGTIWGGEFLLADYTGYRRLAHFAPVPMLGGDVATREPWRNAYAHVVRAIGWAEAKATWPDLPLMAFLGSKPLGVLDAMMARGLNTPEASSAGRLFDAVAAAVGVCRERALYEGQAAIELEALAAGAMNDPRAVPYVFDLAQPCDPLESGGGDITPHFRHDRALTRPSLAANSSFPKQPWVAGSSPAMTGVGLFPSSKATLVPAAMLTLGYGALWRAVLTDIAEGVPVPVIAARFHKGLSAAIIGLVLRLAAVTSPLPWGEGNCDTVVLTGGVFQNRLLLETVSTSLTQAGLRVLIPSQFPANDGGIALGQAVIAAASALSAS